MIKNIKYNENGDIVIDNTELLKDRADISYEEDESNGFNGDRNGLGGIPGEEEQKLKHDERNRWHEPIKPMEVMHVCPVCNTKFKGRTNRVYCTTRCKEVGKKRRQRQRIKDIKNFKPYRGKTGEVYFLNGAGSISFIPAISAENREKAREYIKNNYRAMKNSPKQIEGYVEQVNTVIKKNDKKK